SQPEVQRATRRVKKMRGRKRLPLFLGILAAAALAVGLMAGVGSAERTKATAGYKIFLLPKFIGIPVFTQNNLGAKAAAKALADRLQGEDRNPLRDADRREPEHLDQVHEAGPGDIEVQGHEARQGRLRQRQRHEVCTGNPGPAAGVSRSQGDHRPDYSRRRSRCAGAVAGQEMQRRPHRARTAQPDADVRQVRLREEGRAVERVRFRLSRRLRRAQRDRRQAEWSGRPVVHRREAACLLNTGDREAQLRLTFFFEDRDPIGPVELRLGARRTWHLRLDDPDSVAGVELPRGVPYAYAVESDVPIVLQHSRLDTSAGAYTLLTTIGYGE